MGKIDRKIILFERRPSRNSLFHSTSIMRRVNWCSSALQYFHYKSSVSCMKVKKRWSFHTRVCLERKGFRHKLCKYINVLLKVNSLPLHCLRIFLKRIFVTDFLGLPARLTYSTILRNEKKNFELPQCSFRLHKQRGCCSKLYKR